MSAPVPPEYPTSPIPENDGNDNSYGFGFDDDDDFLIEEGDDDDDLSLGELNEGEAPPPSYNFYPGVAMCIICHQRPAFSKGGRSYPTCGMNCAGILSSGQTLPQSSGRGSQRGRGGRSGRGGHQAMHGYGAVPQNSAGGYYAQDDVPQGYHNPNMSHLAYHLSGGRAPPGYQAPPPPPRQQYFPQAPGTRGGLRPGSRTLAQNRPRQQQHQQQQQQQQQQPHPPRPPPAAGPKCVICLVKPCYDSKYVTCGLTCAEKLCKAGASGGTMCNYCHRRPKLAGHEQCGQACRDSARTACLLCKSRPKFGRYHLCGKSCKLLATKSTPLILEAPPGHATFDLVEKKFKGSWKASTPPCPPIKKIYKIIEGRTFLTPYDKYKRQIGHEVFRYHGTGRKCTLGSAGNTQLCAQTACALCSILRTSFKVSLANPSGAFGAGVYTSSASNKSYSYTVGGTGAIILCKVVLGKIRSVNGWNEVMSCPPGFNSVVFDRQNGTLNETIVYSDDAIRPVFLIVF